MITVSRRLAVLVALIAVSGQALSTTPAPPPPSRAKDCVPGRAKLSEKNFEAIAVAAIQSRVGIELKTGQFKSELFEYGCGAQVAVRTVSLRKPRLFFVEIDALGKVESSVEQPLGD